MGEELQDALAATMKEFSWGPGFIPAVVKYRDDERHFGNNNRSLYVFQTIKKVFPNTTMMIPYKQQRNLSKVHRRSSIQDCDGMAVQFPGFRRQQGDERTEQIMSLFKQDSQ